MAKLHGTQRTVTATKLRRILSAILRRLHQRREHIVIQSNDVPVAVILSIEEYERLTARRGKPDKLLAGINPYNLHHEIDTGDAVGKEV